LKSLRFRKSSTLSRLDPAKPIQINGEKVILREKRVSDARDDYNWQKDPELSRLDSAPQLTISFPLYLLEYTEIIKDFGPGRFPLAIDTFDGRHIGNCTCYDINEFKREAQIGIMVGDRDYWNSGYGTDAIKTILDYLFLKTDLRRAYLKTLDWNLRAQACFKKCGFSACGHISSNGSHFIVMDLTRRQWEKRKDGAKNE